MHCKQRERKQVGLMFSTGESFQRCVWLQEQNAKSLKVKILIYTLDFLVDSLGKKKTKKKLKFLDHALLCSAPFTRLSSLCNLGGVSCIFLPLCRVSEDQAVGLIFGL